MLDLRHWLVPDATLHNSRRLVSSSIASLYSVLSVSLEVPGTPPTTHHPSLIRQSHRLTLTLTRTQSPLACRPNQGRLTCDAFRQAPAFARDDGFRQVGLKPSSHLIPETSSSPSPFLSASSRPLPDVVSYFCLCQPTRTFVLFAPPPHRPPTANGPGGSSGVRLIHGQREQFQFQLHYTRTQGANIDDFSGSGWHVRLALERVGSHGYVDQHHAGLPQGLQNTGLRTLSAPQDQMRPQHALLQLPQGASYRFELSSASSSALAPATSAFSVYAS